MMKTKTQLWYVMAGLVMVSLFFLMPPWTTAKVILGVAPLLFLLMIGITVYRARKKQAGADLEDESRK
jgi:cytochrome c-type biogenesis protein CcmH/NrfF